MDIIPILCGVIASAATFTITYGHFFDEENDFWTCVRYTLKSNMLSWLDKDLDKDIQKTNKLAGFLFFGGIVGALIWWITKMIMLKLS